MIDVPKNFCLTAVMYVAAICLSGCADHTPKPWGEERQQFLPGDKQLVWAVAPTINLSGQSHVDPLLTSDLVFSELQQIHGLAILPVNRVAEVYASLKIEQVQTQAQAFSVCDLLGADGLVIPTVTAYDPYDPPKIGASLQLFLKPGSYRRLQQLDVHALSRAATVGPAADSMSPHWMFQAVGMYDASDGTVRDRVTAYALGRTDPNSPFVQREVYVNMDRYTSFAYHELIVQLLDQLRPMMNPEATALANP